MNGFKDAKGEFTAGNPPGMDMKKSQKLKAPKEPKASKAPAKAAPKKVVAHKNGSVKPSEKTIFLAQAMETKIQADITLAREEILSKIKDTLAKSHESLVEKIKKLEESFKE